MSIMVGTGRGAQMGVLIKNAESAGALREGRHPGRRQDRHADRGQAEAGRGRAGAGLRRRRAPAPGREPRAGERAPAGRGHRRRRRGSGASALRRPRTSRRVTGKGVTGVVDGRRVALGNVRLLEDLGIDVGAARRGGRPAPERTGRRSCSSPSTARLAGLVGVADPIKATTAEALQTLRDDGMRIVMLTGDNRATAEAVARKLGIDEVVAEVLPERQERGRGRLRRRGSDRRHGRRRHQRRARSGRRRRRHRHGHRRRRRDGERRRHPGQGRPARHRRAPAG